MHVLRVWSPVAAGAELHLCWTGRREKHFCAAHREEHCPVWRRGCVCSPNSAADSIEGMLMCAPVSLPVISPNTCCPQAPLCLDLSPLGFTVVGGTDGHLETLSTSSKERVALLEGHVADVYTCKFFPSGKVRERSIRLHRVVSRDARAVALQVVLSGGADMALRVWDATSGHCAAVLKGHTSAVLGISFVERGRNIVGEWADALHA